ncbi:hypothetical protein NEOKW01_1371 [Nematocida sp. AWRm80]|nr:hypothetical protein NEOKW01_1371 [Nematocida sp. AWRm80]
MSIAKTFMAALHLLRPAVHMEDVFIWNYHKDTCFVDWSPEEHLFTTVRLPETAAKPVFKLTYHTQNGMNPIHDALPVTIWPAHKIAMGLCKYSVESIIPFEDPDCSFKWVWSARPQGGLFIHPQSDPTMCLHAFGGIIRAEKCADDRKGMAFMYGTRDVRKAFIEIKKTMEMYSHDPATVEELNKLLMSNAFAYPPPLKCPPVESHDHGPHMPGVFSNALMSSNAYMNEDYGRYPGPQLQNHYGYTIPSPYNHYNDPIMGYGSPYSNPGYGSIGPMTQSGNCPPGCISTGMSGYGDIHGGLSNTMSRINSTISGPSEMLPGGITAYCRECYPVSSSGFGAMSRPMSAPGMMEPPMYEPPQSYPMSGYNPNCPPGYNGSYPMGASPYSSDPYAGAEYGPGYHYGTPYSAAPYGTNYNAYSGYGNGYSSGYGNSYGGGYDSYGGYGGYDDSYGHGGYDNYGGYGGYNDGYGHGGYDNYGGYNDGYGHHHHHHGSAKRIIKDILHVPSIRHSTPVRAVKTLAKGVKKTGRFFKHLFS